MGITKYKDHVGTISPIIQNLCTATAAVVATLAMVRTCSKESPAKPLISLEAKFDAGSSVTFVTSETFSWNGRTYLDKFERFFAQGMVEGQLGELLVKHGYVTREKLENGRKSQIELSESLAPVKCHLPLLVRVRNNGNLDTTIESMTIQMTTHDHGYLNFSSPKINIPLSANKVVDLELKGPDRIEIPYFLLLLDELPLVLNRSSEEMSEMTSVIKSGGKNFNGLIDTSVPAIVSIKDQHSNVATTSLDLKPIASLLKKSLE